MCVYPEWPECVIQIKGEHFRERKAVVESRRCHGCILQWLGVLSFGPHHIHDLGLEIEDVAMVVGIL